MDEPIPRISSTTHRRQRLKRYQQQQLLLQQQQEGAADTAPKDDVAIAGELKIATDTTITATATTD